MTEPIDVEQAYAKFLPEALGSSPEPLPTYRLDVDAAMTQVQSAVEAVADKRDAIAAELPGVDVDALFTLPEVAAALKYATLQADRVTLDPEMNEKLIEARKLRMTLLAAARDLASQGLVPQEDVDEILRGRGMKDLAEDCVALARLFRKHEKAIAGKHSVDPAAIAQAAAAGLRLIRVIDSVQEGKEGAHESGAAQIRNRFTALLVERYGALQKVVVHFFGKEHEKIAPPLLIQAGTVG